MLLKFPKPSLLLHPSVIAILTWSTVVILYSMHLSNLLLYDRQEAIDVFLLIVSPVLLVSLTYAILRTHLPGNKDGPVVRPAPPIQVIRRRLALCARIWCACAIFETIVSRGVPLFWLLVGNGRANFEYGISSVHGLVNSLLLALGVGYWTLYLYTGHRRFLYFPAFAFLWAIIMVSRGTLFVLLLEYAVIFLRLRPIKVSTLIRLAVIGFVALLFFGYIGDVRSGAEDFRMLAQPTQAFPGWAPSGFLWAYIYITTPLNNLMLTMHTVAPSYNILLPATAATLFPSILRNLLYGADYASKLISGALQNEALNVSTAYVGPFQDMGVYGIVGFSAIAGLLCEIFWHRSGFWNVFVLAVFTQALILSLFYNLLFSLPILGQLIWFYYFTRLSRPASRTARFPQALALPS